MRTTLYAAFRHEFIAVSGESRPGLPPAKEYDPPLVPPRYVTTGGLVFLSGVTWDTGTLDEQLDVILPRIDGSLQDAGASWAHVVKLSCFLHRSQTVQALRTGLQSVLGAQRGTLLGEAASTAVEYSFVDGYSTPGKLIEIETTAVL